MSFSEETLGIKGSIFGLLVALFLVSGPVEAATPAFTVRPSIDTLDSRILFENAEKGQTLKGSLNLTLRESVPTHFEFGFNSGSVQGDEDLKALTLSSWVSFPEGNKKFVDTVGTYEVPFEINVPAGAIPGDYYGSFIVSIGSYGEAAIEERAQVSETKLGTGARVRMGIGVETIVRVQGDVVSKLSFKDFEYNKTRDDQILELTLITENEGTVSVKPTASINIYNLFGEILYSKEHSLSLNNPYNGESSDTITINPKEFILGNGVYKVDIDLSYKTFSFAQDGESIVDFAGKNTLRIFNIPNSVTGAISIFVLLPFAYVGYAFIYRRIIAKNSVKYTVVKGDTLQSVSERFKVDPKKIIFVNKLKEPYFLVENSDLLIPNNNGQKTS